jgi:hypothetical protein
MKHMAKRALLGLALAPLVLGTSACVSRNPNVANHWSIESVETSIRQHVFGHASSDANALRDAYYDDADNVLTTFSRHVMNDNQDNPLLPRTTGLGILPTSRDYELPAGGYQSSGN